MNPSTENDGEDFGVAKLHPRTYRIDSIEVEAVQWDGTAKGSILIIDWILQNGDRCARYVDYEPGCAPTIDIDTTAFNKLRAYANSWILRLPNGRFFVCADETFRREYKPVAEKSEAASTAIQELADELNAVGATRAQREGREMHEVAAEILKPVRDVVVSFKQKVDDLNEKLAQAEEESAHERVDDVFSFHPADTEEKRNAHENVRSLLRATAHELIDRVPPSDARTLALQHLADAMHWANSAIARYGVHKSQGV